MGKEWEEVRGEQDGLRRVGGRPWPCSAETTSYLLRWIIKHSGIKESILVDAQYICSNMRTGEVRIKPLNYPILHLHLIYWQLQVG